MGFINHLSADQQFVFFSFVKIVCVVLPLLFIVAYAVLVERKLSAFIQDRVGPNRVGPGGIWQPLADTFKFLLKEDYTPAHVRKVYFWLAPAITMVPALLTMAVIPFGSTMGKQQMVIANLNVGILYTFGIVSLGVYGIVLAGYAANSKYPFLGGIRSSAQMISYEIAMGMSVIPVFLIAGFAETNRTPFDLPEAETELVGGYHTEYGSMKFALFFLAEYSNMVATSAMMVTLFF